MDRVARASDGIPGAAVAAADEVVAVMIEALMSGPFRATLT
jgi:hypothetical protein